MISRIIKNVLLNVLPIVLFGSSAMAQTILIDVVDYITQVPPAIICQANGAYCLNGYWNQYGEFVYVSSNGTVDYIARSTNASTTPALPVGIIRNIDGTGAPLRCFASPGQPCTAPPSSSNMPEKLPKIFLVNVVSWATEQASENTDIVNGQPVPNGTPRTTIAGAVTFSGWQSFDWVNMDSSGNQTRQGSVDNLVTAVYVLGVQFGGDIGTRDALVIDEQEGNSGIPNHIERFFYVKGWGRVREAVSYWNVNTNQYNAGPFVNSIRNTLSSTLQGNGITPPAINPPPNCCPQGSAPWN